MRSFLLPAGVAGDGLARKPVCPSIRRCAWPPSMRARSILPDLGGEHAALFDGVTYSRENPLRQSSSHPVRPPFSTTSQRMLHLRVGVQHRVPICPRCSARRPPASSAPYRRGHSTTSARPSGRLRREYPPAHWRSDRAHNARRTRSRSSARRLSARRSRPAARAKPARRPRHTPPARAETSLAACRIAKPLIMPSALPAGFVPFGRTLRALLSHQALIRQLLCRPTAAPPSSRFADQHVIRRGRTSPSCSSSSIASCASVYIQADGAATYSRSPFPYPRPACQAPLVSSLSRSRSVILFTSSAKTSGFVRFRLHGGLIARPPCPFSVVKPHVSILHGIPMLEARLQASSRNACTSACTSSLFPRT